MNQINTRKKDTTFLNKYPIGHLTFYYGNEVPDGYIICKGQILNTDTNPEYLELYKKIGNIYGGNDHTNFRLPTFHLKGSRKVNSAIIKYFQPLVNLNQSLISSCKTALDLVKCECGSDSTGLLSHSNWCPKG